MSRHQSRGFSLIELLITLVVIGGDYREETELLKLEGVSISFLD